MRIVHICMTQYSDGWSYQENLLAKFHKKMGYDVTVITSEYCFDKGKLVKDSRMEFIDINGVKVVRLEVKNKGVFNKTPQYKEFNEKLNEIKPDIIFSHGCQYIDVLNIIEYKKKNLSTKIFVDNHADFSNSAKTWLSKNILHRIVWRYYAKKISEYTEIFWGVLPARVDFLVNMYGIPKSKCKLLVMGADDEYLDKSKNQEIINNVKKTNGISDEDFIIVSGGKIDRAKYEIIYLMEAIKKIKSKNVKLIIFGSVDKDLEEIFFSEIDGAKVIYVGWVATNETYQYFDLADLVVFPGRHSVLWEQVAGQGIPMICKYWQGTTTHLQGENIIYLSNPNAHNIKTNIEQIVNDRVLYEKMLNAAIQNKKNFLYSNIAKISIGE